MTNIDIADLVQVTGGTGDDQSSALQRRSSGKGQSDGVIVPPDVDSGMVIQTEGCRPVRPGSNYRLC
jgi:hypothetical protein